MSRLTRLREACYARRMTDKKRGKNSGKPEIKLEWELCRKCIGMIAVENGIEYDTDRSGRKINVEHKCK